MAKDIIQFSPHPKTPAAFVVTINGEPITPKDSTMLRRALHQASMQERLLEQLNLQRCAAKKTQIDLELTSVGMRALFERWKERRA